MTTIAPPPPHNESLERAVLCAAMLDRIALDAVVSQTDAADYYMGDHQSVYRALAHCHEHNVPTDAQSLQAIMLRQGTATIDDDGRSILLLAQIATETATSANVGNHITQLLEAAVRRSLLVLGDSAGLYARDLTKEPSEIIQGLDLQLMDLAGAREGGFTAAAECLEAAMRDAVLARAEGRKTVGYTTGFTEMDNQIGGLERGNLYLLAARPSVGKTALALCIARNFPDRNADAGVAICSLEMTSATLAVRLLTMDSGLQYRNIRSGMFSESDQGHLTSCLESMSRLPIHIDDTPSLSPTELKARLRQLQRRSTIGLVVIDYLQLMTGKGQSREQEISYISRSLKAVAMELDVPVLALSQLSRDIEKRPGGLPQLSDLRESGALEQDADTVMFLHRPTDSNADSTVFKDKMEVRVAKCRNGAVGSFLLGWEDKAIRFHHLDRRDA